MHAAIDQYVDDDFKFVIENVTGILSKVDYKRGTHPLGIGFDPAS